MPRQPLSLHDTVLLSDQVVFRELDGEGVLLHLDKGIYFGLNDVGTRIWALLQEKGSLQTVFEALQRQYQVEPERLEKDLLALIAQMLEKNLVLEQSQTPVSGG